MIAYRPKVSRPLPAIPSHPLSGQTSPVTSPIAPCVPPHVGQKKSSLHSPHRLSLAASLMNISHEPRMLHDPTSEYASTQLWMASRASALMVLYSQSWCGSQWKMLVMNETDCLAIMSCGSTEVTGHLTRMMQIVITRGKPPNIEDPSQASQYPT